MPIGKVWLYGLLFVILFVCTVTDFSAKDKSSDVKFCTVVNRRPGQGISHFGELSSLRSSPISPKWGMCGCAVCMGLEHVWPVRSLIWPACWPHVESECVDIRLFLKTDILVLILVSLHCQYSILRSANDCMFAYLCIIHINVYTVLVSKIRQTRRFWIAPNTCYSSVKHSGVACGNEMLHSFTCCSHV